MLTDIVDSTALVEDLGDKPAADLFRRIDRITRDLLQTSAMGLYDTLQTPFFREKITKQRLMICNLWINRSLHTAPVLQVHQSMMKFLQPIKNIVTILM